MEGVGEIGIPGCTSAAKVASYTYNEAIRHKIPEMG
jgi:hypothetical protein